MIGNEILYLENVDSTNDYIKRNQLNLQDGFMVVAKEQSKGRGRFSNVWQSPKGNLYLSFLIKQTYQREKIFQLHIITSLAIINTLKNYNIKAKIKYPNDIVCKGKKIAGILIETSGFNSIDLVIIGLGVNLNQIDFYELNDKATSIKKETNKDCSIDNFVAKFVQEYNKITYTQETYNKYIFYSNILNKNINYNNQVFTIKNILPNGNITLINQEKSIEVSYDQISLEELYLT